MFGQETSHAQTGTVFQTEVYLIVVQVKQSQIPHLAEGTGGNLRNTIPSESELF